MTILFNNTPEGRAFVLHDAVRKLQIETGCSYDHAWKTVNSAPEMAEVVSAMKTPESDVSSITAQIAGKLSSPLTKSLMACYEKATGKKLITANNAAVDGHPSGVVGRALQYFLENAITKHGVEKVRKAAETFPPDVAKLIKFLTTGNGDEGTTVSDARTAGKLFVEKVLGAMASRGISYDDAWAAMKRERMSLYESMTQ